MKTYALKIKEPGQWFYRTYRNMIGHRYQAYTHEAQWSDDGKTVLAVHKKLFDKLVLQFADGTMLEIPDWKKCHCICTRSWYEFTKEQMNKDAGQPLAFKIP